MAARRFAQPEDQPADEELSADLRLLGFTDYEARIYVQLLRESPATAYEIAKSARLPRPNTYDALEGLAQRGAVLPVSENPVRYVAAPPADLLGRIAEETRSRCDGLVKRLADLSGTADNQYVWSLQGDAAVHGKIHRMIEESESRIWIKASDDVLRRHAKVLKAAAKRGVQLLIVLYGADADEFRFTKHCRVYLHEGNGFRMGIADNLFTVTVDYREALTANVADDVFAAHTCNPQVVVMADSLIRHDYYMAEICMRFGPEIFAEFGPYLAKLRSATYSAEQTGVFEARTGMAIEPAKTRR